MKQEKQCKMDIVEVIIKNIFKFSLSVQLIKEIISYPQFCSSNLCNTVLNLMSQTAVALQIIDQRTIM
jgi:hypothetical protein